MYCFYPPPLIIPRSLIRGGGKKARNSSDAKSSSSRTDGDPALNATIAPAIDSRSLDLTPDDTGPVISKSNTDKGVMIQNDPGGLHSNLGQVDDKAGMDTTNTLILKVSNHKPISPSGVQIPGLAAPTAVPVDLPDSESSHSSDDSDAPLKPVTVSNSRTNVVAIEDPARKPIYLNLGPTNSQTGSPQPGKKNDTSDVGVEDSATAKSILHPKKTKNTPLAILADLTSSHAGPAGVGKAPGVHTPEPAAAKKIKNKTKKKHILVDASTVSKPTHGASSKTLANAAIPAPSITGGLATTSNPVTESHSNYFYLL